MIWTGIEEWGGSMRRIDMNRRKIEKLYVGKCTITEYRPVTDSITKLTKNKEVNILTNEKCLRSYKSLSATTETAVGNKVRQAIKLFVAPELIIAPGSKITVTQNGRTTAYSNSGEPAVYETHQELELSLFKGWA